MTKAKSEFPQALNDFYKSNGVEHRVGNDEPSMTRQEFADECDINMLMKRYEGHGQTINYLLAQPAQGGQYLDFADIPDTLMGYMEFMKTAEAAFMTLPAIVRKEFENNAYAFCEFASDPSNLDQMRTWGLAAPAKPEVAEGLGTPPGGAAPPAPPAAPAAPGAPLGEAGRPA